MAISTNKTTDEWLDAFCRMHQLNNYEEALEKLIGCYKAWNLQLFAKEVENE